MEDTPPAASRNEASDADQLGWARCPICDATVALSVMGQHIDSGCKAFAGAGARRRSSRRPRAGSGSPRAGAGAAPLAAAFDPRARTGAVAITSTSTAASTSALAAPLAAPVHAGTRAGAVFAAARAVRLQQRRRPHPSTAATAFHRCRSARARSALV